MGRLRRSMFEDVIDITSRLPWQAGVILALVSFLILHGLAAIEVAKPSGVGQMETFAVKQLYVTLAMFGQYVLPAAFLIGAVCSVILRIKNRKLYDSIQQHSAPQEKHLALQLVERMSWQQFETLVAESFRQRGYQVEEVGGGGADGGIDLKMTFQGKKYIVQCKQWKTFKVVVQVVREFFGVMVDACAAGGFIVTSGTFTDETVSFAAGKHISLIDGDKLLKIINGVEPSLFSSISEERHAERVLVCPKCGSLMVRRTAKSGNNAGNEFWGCSSYPKCQQIINIGN